MTMVVGKMVVGGDEYEYGDKEGEEREKRILYKCDDGLMSRRENKN